MLLLHLLLFVFIHHQLHAKDLDHQPHVNQFNRNHIPGVSKKAKLPKDTNYVFKYIEQCPDIGYYFGKDPSSNKVEPDPCYLCFCHRGKYALCWVRDNRRCDVNSFQYHKTPKKLPTTNTENIASNNMRVRRNPSFFNFFNRDAFKDMFSIKGESNQCRPYESSFSDDCPPADWCTGCTVCDCDGKGRWNCHILKFCPEMNKKDKKPIDKSRRIMKRKSLPNSNLNTTKRIAPFTPGPIKRGVSKIIVTTKKKYIKKSIARVNKSVNITQANKTVVKTTKMIYLKPKTKHFKKNMTTKTPKKIKFSQSLGDIVNGVHSLESQVVQKVMAAVRNMVDTELRNMTTIYVSKVQKLPTPTTKSSVYKPKYNKKLFKRENAMKHNKVGQNRLKRALEDQEEALQEAILSGNNSKTVNVTTTTDILLPGNDDYLSLPMNIIQNNEDNYYKYFVSSLSRNTELTEKSSKTTAIVSTNTKNATEVTANKLKTTNVNKNETETEESIPIHKEYILKEIEPTIVIEVKNDTINTLTITKPTAATENVSKNVFVLDTPIRVIVGDFTLNKTEVHPKLKESKYNEWAYLKNPKNNKLKTAIKNANNLIVNKPLQVHANNKRKHINRINVSKKINLYRILNYHKCPYLHNLLKKQNETRYKIRGGLENILKKTLHDSIKSQKKHNKMSVILYIRKILDSIFKKNTKYGAFSRRHVLQSLCKNFGPCNFDRKNKYILSSKLADLDHETVSILKTVNIIKGLLIFLDNNIDSIKNSSKEGRLRYNIQRLNNILKGNYTSLTNQPLTETKVGQLDLMKKNIENFVESVRKFTTLLNDVIVILTKINENLNGKNINKSLFRHESNETNLVQSLKHMLIKYNLIQNNFMKKMYEIINKLDSKATLKQKVRYDKDNIKDSGTYSNLSRNILENLRKLKHLAQTLSYNKRSKRAIQNEDPIEYLLLLMEYLLKQHQPYDVHPVNDGIDLLIEAIKNAPDIKTVRKKVLTNTNFTHNSTKMLHRSAIENVSSNNEAGTDTISYEDSSKNLNEVNADLLNGKLVENKDIFEIVDDEKESEEKLQFDRRSDHAAFRTTEPSSVSMFSYADNEHENPFYEDMLTSPSSLLEKLTTSVMNGSTDLSNDIESGSEDENENIKKVTGNDNGRRYNDKKVYINQFTEKVYTYEPLDEVKLSNIQTHRIQAITDTTDKINNVATETSTTQVTEESLEKEDGDKKIETVFTADIDENEATFRKITSTIAKSPSTTPSETDSPQNNDFTITEKTLNKNARVIVDKKSKLEWIEENFHRDFNNYDDEKDAIKIPTASDDIQSTKKVDVSSISNEIDNGTNRKKKSKITKDVMLRKQMDLMNSLDYGTERIELEDADTTEINIDDRESDSSYFV